MTPNELLRALRRIARQRGLTLHVEAAKGSYHLVRLGGRRATLAMHRGDIPHGTLASILKQLQVDRRDL
jgi:predicted RNA binding protein YcfA (HicA-like mRNA interferase family)